MEIHLTAHLWWLYAGVSLVAFAACVLLILVLRPILQHYAMSQPNARSSHKLPTPQGGGVAVIVATIGVWICAIVATGSQIDAQLPSLCFATLLLTGAGVLDDLKPVPILPRLILQASAVAIVLASLPAELRVVHHVPVWLERAALLLAALWFVNLVNFMDGLDWMTAAEVVPAMAALACIGIYGGTPISTTLLALALGGAMLGFAPFNKPVARLFLGDAGSLPIGLLMGWCLLQLAARGHVTAALLIPLYYLADATVTLGRRVAKGEQAWQAHRTHFYQRAIDNGFTAMQVALEVFTLNVALAVLAAISIFQKTDYIDAVTGTAGVSLVAFVLWRFSNRRLKIV